MADMSRSLLLVSNSTQHGQGYLGHCEGAMMECLRGCESLLFVPYALADCDGYAATAAARFSEMGLRCSSVHEYADPRRAVESAEAMFIGGGNSFRLLSALYEHELIEAIRARVASGMPYMGASAGTNMACPTIRTTNDMPILEPPSFGALSLIPFQINPHYLDADPGSTHMGETREQRLSEFLEENPGPVLGLREGAWLRVQDSAMALGGTRPARLLQKDGSRKEYPPGSDLSFLLRDDD